VLIIVVVAALLLLVVTVMRLLWLWRRSSEGIATSLDESSTSWKATQSI
jgi:hypothetical protein